MAKSQKRGSRVRRPRLPVRLSMERKNKRRDKRAQSKRRLPRRGVLQCNRKQPQTQKVKKDGVGRTQIQTGQMISEWLHTPYDIIELQSGPGERSVKGHMKGREHPVKLRPAETSEVGIL